MFSGFKRFPSDSLSALDFITTAVSSFKKTNQPAVLNLKQNEAQSACAASTNKGVN